MTLLRFLLFGLILCFCVPLWSTTLTMDVLPSDLGWFHWDCGDSRESASVTSGILTISTQSCDEFFAPADLWTDQVNRKVPGPSRLG